MVIAVLIRLIDDEDSVVCIVEVAAANCVLFDADHLGDLACLLWVGEAFTQLDVELLYGLLNLS